MDPPIALMNVALGAVLGMVGQGVRVIVGLKKEADEARAADCTLESCLDLRAAMSACFSDW